MFLYYYLLLLWNCYFPCKSCTDAKKVPKTLTNDLLYDNDEKYITVNKNDFFLIDITNVLF